MHLNNSEIILYTTQFGLTESQRYDVESHLLLCEECTSLQKQYANEIQAQITENELECKSIEDDFADYLLSDLSQDRQHMITQHLETCESCRFLFDSLKNFSADSQDGFCHKPNFPFRDNYQVSDRIKRSLWNNCKSHDRTASCCPRIYGKASTRLNYHSPRWGQYLFDNRKTLSKNQLVYI